MGQTTITNEYNFAPESRRNSNVDPNCGISPEKILGDFNALENVLSKTTTKREKASEDSDEMERETSSLASSSVSAPISIITSPTKEVIVSTDNDIKMESPVKTFRSTKEITPPKIYVADDATRISDLKISNSIMELPPNPFRQSSNTSSNLVSQNTPSHSKVDVKFQIPDKNSNPNTKLLHLISPKPATIRTQILPLEQSVNIRKRPSEGPNHVRRKSANFPSTRSKTPIISQISQWPSQSPTTLRYSSSPILLANSAGSESTTSNSPRNLPFPSPLQYPPQQRPIWPYPDAKFD
ncbi:hypothetical protein HK096_000607, partial [Nowakowskiella sp. JEL0078]